MRTKLEVNDFADIEIIYPENLRKYSGKPQTQGRRWRVLNIAGYPSGHGSFDTYEEAEIYIRAFNIENGLVRNTVYRSGDEYYCAVGKYFMRFDEDALPIVDAYFIHLDEGPYGVYARTPITTNLKTKSIQFAQLICKVGPGQTVDHISGDTLDNRARNLRPASPKVQSTNQKVRRDNTTGIRGVCLYPKKGPPKGYRVSWLPLDAPHNKVKLFTFSLYNTHEEALQCAVAFRAEQETTLPHYIEALQPRADRYAKEHEIDDGPSVY